MSDERKPVLKLPTTLTENIMQKQFTYRSRRDHPRFIYREKEARRVEESPTLTRRYPSLKSLSADFCFTSSARPTARSEIKYTMDVAAAKTVFRVGCTNSDCVRGDFDFTDAVAKAVAHRRP